jgi:uroporphyrinogen decarboxylase
MLFGRHLGLQMFSYLWADERDLVLRWMRALEAQQRHYIELTAHPETSSLSMIYSDVAFKQSPMFSKRTFNDFGFFDDVATICDACHAKGLQVIFHSDGDIMSLVDDLVAAGIDGLNPLEKAAGMDVYALRKRYPELILVGGVDVTHLLREGTPDQVRKETRRMIDELGSEGRLLIGSSTEVSEHVPLENYLAFHDEAMAG